MKKYFSMPDYILKGKEPAILALSALTLFVIAYFPVFQILVKKWATSDEYTHAFFTVPIILYMLWNKKEFLRERSTRYSGPGLLLVSLSIILYLVALQLQIPTFSALTMVMTLVSVLIYLFGFKVIKHLAMPIILLVIIIPIPNQVYSMITLPLQLKASQISEHIIRLFNVPVFREGNVINIPAKVFQVVEACSGMRSLITLVTLSLILADFTLKKNLLKLLLILASMPVAFLVNIIRVVVMVLAFHYFRLDMTAGVIHTLTGIALFGLALAALLALQGLLATWENQEKQN